MKVQVTYTYDSEDEFRAAMAGGETRTVESEPVVEPEVTETAERDGDGMPWNPDYHSDPRSFTADGLWRAKRGSADAAKDARAKFKAAGGVTVPVAPVVAATTGMPDTTVRMPTMPDTNVRMPTMPVAASILPPPVSMDALVTKITGMMLRGVINVDTVSSLYQRVGIKDGAECDTNETARSALFAELVAIEP